MIKFSWKKPALAALLTAALAVQPWRSAPALAHSDDESSSDDVDLTAPRWVSPETARFINLKTEEPRMRPLAETATLTGRVMSHPDLRSKVCTRLSGKIVSLNAHVGDEVKAGDVLATLESPELVRNLIEASRLEAEHLRFGLEAEKAKVEAESMKRTIRVSELQVDAAQEELKRLEARQSAAPNTANPMAALELANRQESVTRTIGDLRINKLQVQVTETTIANLTQQAAMALEASNMLRALGQSDGGVVKIVADKPGSVVARPISTGEWAQTGQTLFEITDRSMVQIVADIPETLLPRIQEKLPRRAWVWVANQNPIEAKPVLLGGAIHPVRRTAELFIDAPNVNHSRRTLLENAWVTVTLPLTEASDVLSIPRSAVLKLGSQRFVFVKSGDSYVKQDVATGLSDEQFVEIKAGMTPGDTVVTQGAEALLHLRPVNAPVH